MDWVCVSSALGGSSSSFLSSVRWWVGRWVGSLVGWLVGGWWVGWLAHCLVGWLLACVLASFFPLFVGWLVGGLVRRMVGGEAARAEYGCIVCKWRVGWSLEVVSS